MWKQKRDWEYQTNCTIIWRNSKYGSRKQIKGRRTKRNKKKNKLKIEIFPENKPRYEFKKEPVKQLITEDTIGYSFDKNRNLAFIKENVPLLSGFFQSHINHYPIRISQMIFDL